MGRLIVVSGGQFGSEAKGHVAAQIARTVRSPLVAVRVAGPNAGHTAYDAKGRKWALRTIPVMAVVDMECELVLAAGSEIDPAVLMSEVEALEDAGIPIRRRLLIDSEATVIEAAHYQVEADLDMHVRLGSTGKGVGAARASHLLRQAHVWKQITPPEGIPHGVHTGDWLKIAMRHDRTVIIEGTQGYGLGLHAGFYPYCTSSDCRAIDWCAAAGINPWDPDVTAFDPWVVLRTFPIRVAGNSGPLNHETTWEDLGLETNGYIQPEITTVTKKVRRVGYWDRGLAFEAIRANGGVAKVRVALTFLDYIDPEVAGATERHELTPLAWNFINQVFEDTGGAEISMVTTGPDTAVWL